MAGEYQVSWDDFDELETERVGRDRDLTLNRALILTPIHALTLTLILVLTLVLRIIFTFTQHSSVHILILACNLTRYTCTLTLISTTRTHIAP